MTHQKSLRGRMADGRPNPIDTYVGSRILLRRQLLGLSQEKLAALLGITFQQVQKYEKGLNRVGASRLFDLSRVLKCSIEYFFADMPTDISGKSPRKLLTPANDEENLILTDPFMTTEVNELVKSYYCLTPNLRQSLHNLINAMSNPHREVANV